MKKVSTVAAQASRKISQQKLTVGLDLGDRSSWYCVLDEGGAILREERLSTTAKALQDVFGRIPQSRIALETGMLTLGERVAERRGTRSDRGSRAQGALDWREPTQGSSAGCADAGAAGADRSRVAVSGETPQRQSAGGSDRDPGTSGTGASPDRAGQHNRGLAKSYGERLRGCNLRNLNPEKAEGLSPELQRV